MKASPSPLVDSYLKAAEVFRVAETSLASALDGLAARRATGEDATKEYRSAQQLERECNGAWDALELARRAYWMEIAHQAEQELEALALPLLATIKHCHAAGRSGVSLPGYAFLTGLACKDSAGAAVGDARVPIAGIGSDVLERAETEL